MAGETVIIVEDDDAMRRGLKDNFEFEGYRVITAADGQQGLDAILEATPRLVVLDIMLPKVNGYEICRYVRAQGLEVPIIMLTAKGQEADVVLGLNLGADDYVTKPFNINELLARANAFLRRHRLGEHQVLEFGDCDIDLASRTVRCGGIAVDLTPKEFELLAFFLRSTGRALTRDEILRQVWGFDAAVTTRSVDRCVTTLRKKIEVDLQRPVFIRTIREVGYRFDLEPGGSGS
jgi:DNA-binding response OmpR family regulator